MTDTTVTLTVPTTLPEPTMNPVRRQPGTPMMIIGLAGDPGAGLADAAKALWFEHDALITGFRMPAKSGMAAALNLQPEWFDDQLEAREPLDPYGVTPNQLTDAAFALLSDFGPLHKNLLIEFYRHNLPNWLAATENGYAPAIVFSDVSREDEIEFLRSIGAYIIHITKPGLPYFHFRGHADRTIGNEDGGAMFARSVEKVFLQLFKEHEAVSQLKAENASERATLELLMTENASERAALLEKRTMFDEDVALREQQQEETLQRQTEDELGLDYAEDVLKGDE